MSDVLSDLTFREAVRQALREEMLNDKRVFLIGEDIGSYGGAFKVTRNLVKEFGEQRVIDTCLSESAIAGACVGAAVLGIRPVGEIMFTDWITIAMDQIVNNAAKMRYLCGGSVSCPMVIRVPYGAGRSGSGAHHSQSLESWFIHVPGLKVVMPSTPADAKGLLKASIRDNNPVVFFEHKLLYSFRGPVPRGEYTIPLGKAHIKREGKDITLVATGAMVHKALSTSQQLAKDKIDVEVIDPRTLFPLDKAALLKSLRKTGRLVIVEEACKTGGFGGEIAAVVAEEAFDYLKAPIKRIGAPHTPVPASRILKRYFIPDEGEIRDTVRKTVMF